MQLEVKLLKVLELIHIQKLNVLNKQDIKYEDLHKLYTRIEDIYSVVSNKRHRPEFFEVKGMFQEINNMRTKGEQ
jgi:uncharacterized protein YfkK (UPF0435 family)